MILISLWVVSLTDDKITNLQQWIKATRKINNKIDTLN